MIKQKDEKFNEKEIKQTKKIKRTKKAIDKKKEQQEKNPLEFNGKIYKTVRGKRIAQTKYFKNTLIDLNKKKQTLKVKQQIKKIKKLQKTYEYIIKKENKKKKEEKKIEFNFNKLVKQQKKKVYAEEIIANDKIETTINYRDVLKNGYNDKFNMIQINKFIKETNSKKEKGKLYKHEVIYYDENGERNEDEHFFVLREYDDDENPIDYHINLSKQNNTFIFRNFDKDTKNTIWFKMNPFYNSLWKIRLYLARNPQYTATIKTSLYKKIIYETRDNKQIYRENVSNSCFYDGVLQYFINIYDDKPHSSIKGIINKLINNQNIYKKPYTEEEIKEFCEEFKISITIKNYITGDDIIINESKFNKYNIQFINSKYNHLDLLINSYDVEEVDKQQYEKIKLESCFYIERLGELITIQNGLNKTYKTKKTEFDILHKEWRDKYNFNNKFIYTTSDEYSLISEYDYSIHRIFNHTKYTGNETDYIEYDIKKAYYNALNKDFNKFYTGVPSGSFINYKCIDFKINNFKEQMKNNLVGFYQVIIRETKKNLDVLGFKIGSIHTLFSSMINLLSDFVEFEFINVSIAPSFDLKFDEDFLKEGENKLKHYVKAFGILFKENNDMVVNIKPLDEDKQFYKTFFNEKYDVYDINGIYKVVYEIDNPKSYIHIAYCIHSYTTTLIINELLKMDTIDDVLGVKLDSIVIKKNNNYKFDEKIFSNKTAKIQKLLDTTTENNNNLDYGLDLDDTVEINKFGIINPYKIDTFEIIDFKPLNFADCKSLNRRLLFFGGAGGTGKTFTIMNSTMNKKNICYCSSSWDLIQDKQNEYIDIIGLSHQKLTGDADGEKCVKITNNNIKYIVIDELTLIHKKTIDKIINEYNDIFIFLVGDITKQGHSYQCKIYNEIYTPNNQTQYIEFKKTYRFDNDLNDIILKVRESQLTHKDKVNNINLHLKECKKLFADRYFNKEDVKFNDEDVGIIATKNKVDEMTKYFIEKGTKPKYFIKNTDLNKGILRGQELKEKPTNANFEMKLFKTIHSFQGRELKKEQKIIIYLNSYFDYNLFYTAVSRARSLKQIYIIV